MSEDNKNKNLNKISICLLLATLIICASLLLSSLKTNIVYEQLAYGEVFFNNVSSTLMIPINTNFPSFENITNGGIMMGLTKNMFDTNGNSTFVINISGVYMYQYAASVSAGANREIIIAVRIDNVTQPNSFSHRKLGAGGDVGSQSATGLLNLTSGNHLDLGVSLIAGGSTTVEFSTLNFNLVLIDILE